MQREVIHTCEARLINDGTLKIEGQRTCKGGQFITRCADCSTSDGCPIKTGSESHCLKESSRIGDSA